MAGQLADLDTYEISAAMTAEFDAVLADHVHKGTRQEDLSFAYWKPSVGLQRYTAVVTALVLPERVTGSYRATWPSTLSISCVCSPGSRKAVGSPSYTVIRVRVGRE